MMKELERDCRMEHVARTGWRSRVCKTKKKEEEEEGEKIDEDGDHEENDE
jgi:hypothetical protein